MSSSVPSCLLLALAVGLAPIGACGSDDASPAPAAPEPVPVAEPRLLPLDEVHVDPDEVVMVQGSKMVLNPNDTIVSRVIRRDGIWEPLETRLFTQTVRPGDVVVDVGANIGYYTLLAARLVGETGHVYAFEPEPEAFALLERNVALNGYDNVTLVDKALGREAGRLQLYLAKNNRGDHRIYDPTGRRSSIDVDVIALDAYLDERGIERVNLLKVDTQGAECSILDGARRTIASHPELGIVMEFTPHSLAQLGDEPRRCLQTLVDTGYSLLDIEEWKRRIVPTDVDTLLRVYPQDDRTKFTNLWLPPREAGGAGPGAPPADAGVAARAQPEARPPRAPGAPAAP
ncbi:FkbM family methyltransferase [Paraliomyxa miuraensis]|uniref:FkbM family methyltransferase n=1 Tax=Paraliomyxa miuraensis TaxID=376150 RepID=UPI00225301F7|nr:FkbM family methyltransferase [Paraliomyxa miuraensis]MCX4246891.1 FkbM family methyltransferase [Paraliomyxa miuraensis]